MLRCFVSMAALIALSGQCFAQANMQHYAFHLQSHGGTAWPVAAGANWSLCVTASHLFEGQARNRKIVMAMPTTGQPRPVGGTPQLIYADYQADVALIWCPFRVERSLILSPPNERVPASVTMVGYNNNQWPAITIPARVHSAGVFKWKRHEFDAVSTTDLPRPGLSGGPVISKTTGRVIAMVSSRFRTSTGHNYGVHVSNVQIWRVLRAAANRGIVRIGRAGVPAAPVTPGLTTIPRLPGGYPALPGRS